MWSVSMVYGKDEHEKKWRKRATYLELYICLFLWKKTHIHRCRISCLEQQFLTFLHSTRKCGKKVYTHNPWNIHKTFIEYRAFFIWYIRGLLACLRACVRIWCVSPSLFVCAEFNVNTKEHATTTYIFTNIERRSTNLASKNQTIAEEKMAHTYAIVVNNLLATAKRKWAKPKCKQTLQYYECREWQYRMEWGG